MDEAEMEKRKQHRLAGRSGSQAGRSLTRTNYLALTIVLVSLFISFAIAASSSNWLLKQQLLRRLPISEQQVELNDFNEKVVNDEIDADNEEFLRHLKVAARYLDDKLTARERAHASHGVDLSPGPAYDLDSVRYNLLNQQQMGETDNSNLRYQLVMPNSRSQSISNTNIENNDSESETGDDQENNSNNNNNNLLDDDNVAKANLLNYLLTLDKAREDNNDNEVGSTELAGSQTLDQKRANHDESPAAATRSQPKMTTLLEDEDQDQTVLASSYGKLVKSEGTASQSTTVTPTSLFNRLYANITHYLPFLNRVNIAGQAPASNNLVPTNETKVKNQNKGADGPKSSIAAGLQPAKHSVSTSEAIARNQSEQSETRNVKDSGVDINSNSSGKLEVEKEEDHADEEAQSGRKVAKVKISSTSKRLSVSNVNKAQDTLADMVAIEQPTNGAYNSIRQSNLMVPLQADSNADSLLGKYIYAPTQHYYLNAVPASAGASQHLTNLALDQGDEAAGQQGAPLKSAYAFQKAPASMLNFAHLLEGGSAGLSSKSTTSTNDLYFLIMVGAFCMMAVAVVMAAGLFAYRVQQQRKSSQEQDYPTYGVVGPNNMSGGAGITSGPIIMGSPNGKSAASFSVGNYFTSSLSGASSKAGSARHLPDLYGAGQDSGLDKSPSCCGGSSTTTTTTHSSSTNSSIKKNSGASNASATIMSAIGNQGPAAVASDVARMYHYQHQKQQMIISDRGPAGRHTSGSASDSDLDDENDDDGSYTVYECPGLASAHEMEIKNPLFNDDRSP